MADLCTFSTIRLRGKLLAKSNPMTACGVNRLHKLFCAIIAAHPFLSFIVFIIVVIVVERGREREHNKGWGGD